MLGRRARSLSGRVRRSGIRVQERRKRPRTARAGVDRRELRPRGRGRVEGKAGARGGVMAAAMMVLGGRVVVKRGMTPSPAASRRERSRCADSRYSAGSATNKLVSTSSSTRDTSTQTEQLRMMIAGRCRGGLVHAHIVSPVVYVVCGRDRMDVAASTPGTVRSLLLLLLRRREIGGQGRGAWNGKRRKRIAAVGMSPLAGRRHTQLLLLGAIAEKWVARRRREGQVVMSRTCDHGL